MPDETQENPEEQKANGGGVSEEDVPIVVEDESTRPYKNADAPRPTPELDQLKAKVTALEGEKKEQHNQLLRTAADFDNYRKRTRKEIEDARLKAREDVLREILPVVDNLERAVASATESSAVLDGVKLVLRQFGSALDKFEVKSFVAVGQPFDPMRHEAISQVETADHPPGTIATEMQKGYLMGGKLLRPAMVGVAKAPSAPPPAPAESPPSPSEDKPAEPAAAETKPEGEV
jgi:molecular chaperone GrpE